MERQGEGRETCSTGGELREKYESPGTGGKQARWAGWYSPGLVAAGGQGSGPAMIHDWRMGREEVLKEGGKYLGGGGC